MNLVKVTALVATGLMLSACGGGILGEGGERSDKTIDKGRDEKDLSQLKAGIWVDPNGCDHWIIDDGVEGYLSQRLDPAGKPVCSGIAPPGTATGPFREGSDIPDPL